MKKYPEAVSRLDAAEIAKNHDEPVSERRPIRRKRSEQATESTRPEPIDNVLLKIHLQFVDLNELHRLHAYIARLDEQIESGTFDPETFTLPDGKTTFAELRWSENEARQLVSRLERSYADQNAILTLRNRIQKPQREAGMSGEKRWAASRELETELEATIQQSIQDHFLNATALGAYVAYLEQQKKNQVPLEQIELPNGTKFSTLGWNKQNLDRIIDRLKTDLDIQTQAAFIKGNMGEVIPNEETILYRGGISGIEAKQDEFQQILDQIYQYQERIEKLEASKGVKDRFKNALAWLPGIDVSAVQKQIHTEKTILDDLEARAHSLQEEIQMKLYEVKNLPQKLAKDRAAADEERLKAGRHKEIVNTRDRDVANVVNHPYIRHRAKEVNNFSPEQARIQQELQKNITTEQVQKEKLLPNAATLWEIVQNELGLLGSKKDTVTRFIDSWQTSSDAPATKFILEIARLQKAKQLGANNGVIEDMEEKIKNAARLLNLEGTKEMEIALHPEIFALFQQAQKHIRQAPQIIQLIHERIGYTPSTDNSDDISIRAIRYLALLEEYNLAVAQNRNTLPTLKKELVELNESLDIATNPHSEHADTSSSYICRNKS